MHKEIGSKFLCYRLLGRKDINETDIVIGPKCDPDVDN